VNVKFSLRLILALFVTISLGDKAALSQSAKNILFVHMNNHKAPGNILFSKAFEEEMSRHVNHRIFDEYLDESRLGTDYSGIAEGLEKKYASQKMDLIIFGGPEALPFGLQYGDRIWPSIPKIFTVVDSRNVPAKLSDATAIAGTFELSPNVDLMRQLQPDLQHVFYVGGASPQELDAMRGQQEIFKRFAGKLDIVYLNALPWSQLLDRVSHLPPHSAVLFTTYFQDPTGQDFTSTQAARLIAAASNAPVYASFDSTFDTGAIGGAIFSFEDTAKATAELAARILQGEPLPHTAIYTFIPDRIVINWLELARWHLPENLIPTGATVLNRPPSLWERYRQYVLLAFFILALETLLIVFLLVERQRRRRSELAVKSLTSRIINSSEEERLHLARELHDDIGQRLSLIAFEVGYYKTHRGSDAPFNLDEPLQQLETLISDVHKLSHRLHSAKLQHLGLAFATRELCQQLSQKHHLQIDLDVEQVPQSMNHHVSLCFYRVAQEALNNVVKHSGAKSATVRFELAGDHLEMEIADTGKGFDAASAFSGIGLTAMAERVRIVNGKFKVTSKPGHGATIRTTIPLKAESDPHLPSKDELSTTESEK
jgi:signal transduction histidine kinase